MQQILLAKKEKKLKNHGIGPNQDPCNYLAHIIWRFLSESPSSAMATTLGCVLPPVPTKIVNHTYTHLERKMGSAFIILGFAIQDSSMQSSVLF